MEKAEYHEYHREEQEVIGLPLGRLDRKSSHCGYRLSHDNLVMFCYSKEKNYEDGSFLYMHIM